MTTTIDTSMSGRAWAMLILLSILWGGSFFFIGVAVTELPPLTIVTLRVGLAALTLWLVIAAGNIALPTDPSVWRAFLGMGLLNNVIPFVLIVWGQTQIASGLASILNAATPIFAVVVAGALLPDERITPLKLLGVVAGFMGVVVMIGVPASSDVSHVLPQLAIIGAALSYSFAGVYGRRFKHYGVNPIVTAAGQVTASTLVLLPITWAIDGAPQLQQVTLHTWAAIIALALVSTALAYIIYFKILALSGATNVLLVTLLVPVSAILLGSLFLNESLQPIHFVGMLLIALGLSAIDGRLWRWLKAKYA
ncbi:DMT family transporter [Vibrio renipiscarius]|uniref:DMT family transporter n=1 Tax=Vibrio renipiscarius TaxID=1461322 RepID=UPI003554084A